MQHSCFVLKLRTSCPLALNNDRQP